MLGAPRCSEKEEPASRGPNRGSGREAGRGKRQGSERPRQRRRSRGVKRTAECKLGSSPRFGRTEAAVALTTVTGEDMEAGAESRSEDGAVRQEAGVRSDPRGSPHAGAASCRRGMRDRRCSTRAGRWGGAQGADRSMQEERGDGGVQDAGGEQRQRGGKAAWLSGDIQQGPCRPA